MAKPLGSPFFMLSLVTSLSPETQGQLPTPSLSREWRDKNTSLCSTIYQSWSAPESNKADVTLEKAIELGHSTPRVVGANPKPVWDMMPANFTYFITNPTHTTSHTGSRRRVPTRPLGWVNREVLAGRCQRSLGWQMSEGWAGSWVIQFLRRQVRSRIWIWKRMTWNCLDTDLGLIDHLMSFSVDRWPRKCSSTQTPNITKYIKAWRATEPHRRLFS